MKKRKEEMEGGDANHNEGNKFKATDKVNHYPDERAGIGDAFYWFLVQQSIEVRGF